MNNNARTPTRERRQGIALPDNCITAHALRALANTLDRLAAFHVSRGGASPDDDPCITAVLVEDGKVIARIASGERKFKLELTRGEWQFR